jgi:transcription-repair coupling factor (superfamily II helicase)
MNIRLLLKRLLIHEIECDGRRLILSFHPRTPVSPDTILALIRRQPKRYQFTPDFRLVAELADPGFDGILAEARNLLKSLS